jgi:hypothetical protein
MLIFFEYFCLHVRFLKLFDASVQLTQGSRIAKWYCVGLRAEWSEVRVPIGARNFSAHHRVQTGSGAHLASYPMGTRGSFPGGKAAGA